MNTLFLISILAAATTPPAAVPPIGAPHTVAGEMTLFQMNAYNGDDFTVDTTSSTVHTDWPIRSIAIHHGDHWQICARSRFRDPCIVLDRSIPDASLVGIDGQIGSARPAPTPAAAPAQPH